MVVTNTNADFVAADPATRMAQLAWAIGSAPLLNDALAPHPALTAAEAAQWWRDWQPCAPPAAEPDIRLGSDFEKLWQYWLGAHPHWQLLAHNLPIREQCRTLGELDLLVRHRVSGEQEHWELAVKFYLGFGDLNEPASWHGPQFRDRLDHKLIHLRDEQLCWRERPAGYAALQAAGVAPIRTRAIVKGRLCYPLAAPDISAAFAAPGHERGYWGTAAQWQDWLSQQTVPVQFAYLARTEWLGISVAKSAQAERYSFAALQARLPGLGERPLALRVWLGEQEWPMAFVVPDDWPARAAVHQVAS